MRNASKEKLSVENKSCAGSEDEREGINDVRAGGLAWLRYRLDMAGVEGSNPFRPILKLVALLGPTL
jgi:hypothetical protein